MNSNYSKNKQQQYIQLFIPDLYTRYKNIHTKFQKNSNTFNPLYTNPQLYLLSNEGEFHYTHTNTIETIYKEHIHSLEYECKSHRLYGNVILEEKEQVNIIPFFHKPIFKQFTYYTLQNDMNKTYIENELVYFVCETIYIPYTNDEWKEKECIQKPKKQTQNQETIHELPKKLVEHPAFSNLNIPKEQWKILNKYYFIIHNPDLDNPLIQKHLEKYMRCFF